MANPKHKERNAIRTLYEKVYELDKQWGFRHPSGMKKLDLQAYVNVLLQAVHESFDTAQVPKIKGHELKIKTLKSEESEEE